MGASTLRGTEELICWPDTLSRKVCCLPRTWIRDVTEKLLSVVKPTDCHPLLVFHVGTGDIASSSLGSSKRQYRALGEVVKGFGAQAVFSSNLQVKGEEMTSQI